ncbi:hypothetical protein HX878_31670 [Pseudomonas veronii]|uniref:hypothetical protein n=1 Tax=Pseudomonas veronii TaxID=76761 RepID=UPI0015A04C4C|nr:hypothetical protein [Pseudomonas veronii]NWD59270.1 hypothetical protein [Pseudomonas veronii]
MSKHVNAVATRLCGHSAMTEFSTRRSDSAKDATYARGSICYECRVEISALVAPREKGFYRLALPTLVGATPRQISYANTLRIKVIRQFGPVMAHLATSEGQYAKIALAAYEMLFKITSAGFWAKHTEFPFDASWVISEIESLLQKRAISVNPPCLNSAFKYWMEVDPSVVGNARANLPDTLPGHAPEQRPSVELSHHA